MTPRWNSRLLSVCRQSVVGHTGEDGWRVGGIYVGPLVRITIIAKSQVISVRQSVSLSVRQTVAGARVLSHGAQLSLCSAVSVHHVSVCRVVCSMWYVCFEVTVVVL